MVVMPAYNPIGKVSTTEKARPSVVSHLQFRRGVSALQGRLRKPNSSHTDLISFSKKGLLSEKISPSSMLTTVDGFMLVASLQALMVGC